MAVVKCKMCGGDLILTEGSTIATCEYCGSTQTVPYADNEKKLTLFARANRLRAACEFDKAAGVFETIVSDFPEEAEAYWGLVLCRYGIEYVDDPGTGKKIPTCHRSSFDSIMEDSDFEQALENADAIARRVYREEAKQIEELRKGIIAVSNNELPYDIFICYKETDENGERTLDSVLAQDVYEALTDKGYRVFFSRITLEDKLGVEYEPYIFAALNSAKIMLAFGTDYEYFNAVWVKNEWSRYLKLMEKDKQKHLIPCYKGIDAYDMPKEFARLQAQDLGKIGAMQDLLRGIEKIIPRAKPVVQQVVQEKIVVGSTGGSNKIASLLDRGNMALEDGDWAKADSFFEDVLNNDSKNAQAYLGKTLAQERCRTMDALVRKRRDVYQNVGAETLYIREKTAHIAEMVNKYSLHAYVQRDTIRKLYVFDLAYSSEVSGRQKQYREEENWWQNHRWLSRAEKFASGGVAQAIQNEKKHLFAQLNDRVKKAQEADARSVAKLEASYDAHIAQADKRAEELCSNALARREKEYEVWLEQARKETSPDALIKLAENFTRLGEFRDCKNLAEHCLKRAAEEQDKLDEAEAKRRLVLAQQEKEKAERRRKLQIIASVAAAALLALALLVTQVIIPSSHYKNAEQLLANGNFGAAAIAFSEAGDYKDARERCAAAWDMSAVREVVVTEEEYLAVLQEDGKLFLTSEDDEYKSPEYWTDIIAISGSDNHLIGLKADGTVKSYDNGEYHDKYYDDYYGECTVSQWKDIVAVSTGPHHTAGLRSNGSVVVTPYNPNGEDAPHPYSQDEANKWKDIVAISVGYNHTVGLKSDGTVVATGGNESGQCEVTDWTDIVAIEAGYFCTLGIQSDGSVVVTGDQTVEKYAQAAGWTNIVALEASESHIVGLKADGTMVATGEDTESLVQGWKNVVGMDTSWSRTVAVCADGTISLCGEGSYSGYPTYNLYMLQTLKIPAVPAYAQKIGDLQTLEKTECYAQAEQLLAQGDTVGAYQAFKSLGDFQDSRTRTQETAYTAAEILLAEGKTAEAAMAFGSAGKTGDAWERSSALWQQIASWETISAGDSHAAAIKNDGTVVYTKFTSWRDSEADAVVTVKQPEAVSVNAKGWNGITCLQPDGTAQIVYDGEVSAVGTDIVDMDGNYFLHADGTVSTDGETRLYGWENVIQVADGGVTAALHADGTVSLVGENIYDIWDAREWTDIIAIGVGARHMVGLKSNGTVVAAGDDDDDRCEVSGWTNIKAIAAGTSHTVGLKADGTVVAVGDDEDGRLNVGNWKDIVAIDAEDYTLGLRLNGWVEFTGNDYGNVDKAGNWVNVRQLTANLETVYAQAKRYLDAGDYKNAIADFERLGSYSDSPQKLQLARKGLMQNAQPGDMITFGTKDYLPLQWQVMERSGNTLTLFCTKIITSDRLQKSNSKTIVSNWKSSVLYSNTTKKLGTWFTADEQAMILDTPNGKLYPPSKEELQKLYGVPVALKESPDELITGYYSGSHYSYSTYNWWLRNTVKQYGNEYTFMAVSGQSGYIYDEWATDILGLRPVIKIKVS